MAELDANDTAESEDEQKRASAKLRASEEDRRELTESVQKLEKEREELRKKLDKAEKQLKVACELRQSMEESGAAQISVTDPDCRLMKSHDGFAAAYNVQAAVDSETHIIKEFDVTNEAVDLGQLQPVVGALKERTAPGTVMEVVAARGYESKSDRAACLESGIIPSVIAAPGKELRELETVYEEPEITEEMRCSTDPAVIKEVLRAGRISEVYSRQIEKITVEETYRGNDRSDEPLEPYAHMTEDEAKKRADDGYFVRLPENNVVICPGGETLPQKSIKKNGKIVYAQRAVCQNCKHRYQCTAAVRAKQVEFTEDEPEKPNRRWQREANGGFAPRRPRKCGKMTRQKVVKITFRPDREKRRKRCTLSKHLFGTIKRNLGMNQFLTRGKRKAQGEFALAALGYNMKRAFNLLGFSSMMALI